MTQGRRAGDRCHWGWAQFWPWGMSPLPVVVPLLRRALVLVVVLSLF